MQSKGSNTIMILKTRLDVNPFLFFILVCLWGCIQLFIYTKHRHTAASSTWSHLCRSTFEDRGWRIVPSTRALTISTDRTATNPKLWYPFLPDTETFQLFLAEEIFLFLWRINISSSVPDFYSSPVLETKNLDHLWVQQDEQGALWPHDVLQ